MNKKIYQYEDELKIKRLLANCRERQRTEELNDAFKKLRQTIPSMPSDKMSKIHTLKIATNYIRFLNQLTGNTNLVLPIKSNLKELKSKEIKKKLNKFEQFYSSQQKFDETLLNLRNTFNLWREKNCILEEKQSENLICLKTETSIANTLIYNTNSLDSTNNQTFFNKENSVNNLFDTPKYEMNILPTYFTQTFNNNIVNNALYQNNSNFSHPNCKSKKNSYLPIKKIK